MDEDQESSMKSALKEAEDSFMKHSSLWRKARQRLESLLERDPMDHGVLRMWHILYDEVICAIMKCYAEEKFSNLDDILSLKQIVESNLIKAFESNGSAYPDNTKERKE